MTGAPENMYRQRVPDHPPTPKFAASERLNRKESFFSKKIEQTRTGVHHNLTGRR